MSQNKHDRYESTEEPDALDKYLTGATVSSFKKFSQGETVIRDGEIDR